jgi:hypothetical protein
VVVSQTLRDASSVAGIRFLLTCRLFYDIIDLSAPIYYISGFTREDAVAFARTFAKVYGVDFDAEALLRDLEAHGFSDFLEHPLLLTLACLLKTHLQPDLPRRTVALIRNALDVLRLKWDYEKGLRRETSYPVDGEDRLRCLMRIAFHMKDLEAPETQVIRRAREFLNLAGVPQLDARGLLLEVAQWYGLFVPVEPATWVFTHRTIHDYLAARFWIENGLFDPRKVDWDSRAAYAASLSHDATESLVSALGHKGKVHVVAEILNNNPLYDPTRVASAVLYHFKQYDEYKSEITSSGVIGEVAHDFFDSMGSELLRSLCSAGVRDLNGPGPLILAYALDELIRRPGEQVPPKLFRQIETAVGQRWTFEVKRRTEAVRRTLADVRVGLG